jgi:hypothetical protein
MSIAKTKKGRKKARSKMSSTHNEMLEAKEKYVSKDKNYKAIPDKQRALVL